MRRLSRKNLFIYLFFKKASCSFLLCCCNMLSLESRPLYSSSPSSSRRLYRPTGRVGRFPAPSDSVCYSIAKQGRNGKQKSFFVKERRWEDGWVSPSSGGGGVGWVGRTQRKCRKVNRLDQKLPRTQPQASLFSAHLFLFFVPSSFSFFSLRLFPITAAYALVM